MRKTIVEINTQTKMNFSEQVIAFFKHFLKHKSEAALLFLFYLTMHGGILFIPNAIFWDDWGLYRSSNNVILETFKQAGVMFNGAGYLHVAMQSMGLWSYKVLTFLLMFGAGLLFNSILKKNALLSEQSRFIVVLLFLILPFNFARVAIIDFPYTVCYFLFFLAWSLMDRHRLAALLLFFISFNTNSLLVFYALPILDAAFRGGHLVSMRSFLLFGFRRLDFIVLPLFFFLIKVKFFAPYGIYEGYNQSYGFRNIGYAIKEQIKDVPGIRINFYIFLALIPIVFFVFRGMRAAGGAKSCLDARPRRMLALGISASILGAFPYWILGHAPTFNEWTSRHQLLFPLGAALTIAVVLTSLKGRLKAIGISIVVAGSLSYGVVTYYSFFVDWNKQVAIMKLLHENKMIEGAGLVVIQDETKYFNAINRSYRFYEWNGLLEQAYGDQTRFGIEPKDLAAYRVGNLDRFFLEHYKAGHHKRSQAGTAVLVKILQNKKNGIDDSLFGAAYAKFALSVHSMDGLNFPGGVSNLKGE